MEIYFILLALLFCAFFSGIEIAYISANRLKMELFKKQGSLAGRMLGITTATPARFLGTTLVGGNIAIIVLSILMAQLLESVIHDHLPPSFRHEVTVLAIQTLITTGI